MNAIDSDPKKKTESEKSSSTLQLLFRVSRLINTQALARIEAVPGRLVMRAAHSSLLTHIDQDGTRLTTLAARLGVSKQAVSQLVDEMEQMGILERASDPNDARAKLVRFTAKGKRGLSDNVRVLKDLEEELGNKIGKNRMKDFRKTVVALLAEIDQHFDASQHKA